MAAPTDNGSGPAPTGAAGPSVRHVMRRGRHSGATAARHYGPVSWEPLLPPVHAFLLGEADGAVDAFGGVEAVGFWQPFCFAIAVPTSPD